MSTSISRTFSPWDLLKFAAPSIIMMVFMSLYTIVDGMFISRFVGSNALSSLNIVFPVINVAIAISTMLGTGGNAISKYLGECRDEDARKALTQFTVLCLGFSFLLMLLSLPNLTLISRFLGSSEILLADCRVYLGVSMLFAPAAMPKLTSTSGSIMVSPIVTASPTTVFVESTPDIPLKRDCTVPLKSFLFSAI